MATRSRTTRPRRTKAARPKPAAAPRARTGRPSAYTPALAAVVCDLIAQGVTLRRIGEHAGLPDKATLIRWLARHGDFRDQYARAKELLADVQADEILDIADDVSIDFIEQETADGVVVRKENGEALQRARLRIEARKWLMGKMKPKRYGDKLELGADPDSPPVVGVILVPAKGGSDGSDR